MTQFINTSYKDLVLNLTGTNKYISLQNHNALVYTLQSKSVGDTPTLTAPYKVSYADDLALFSLDTDPEEFSQAEYNAIDDYEYLPMGYKDFPITDLNPVNITTLESSKHYSTRYYKSGYKGLVIFKTGTVTNNTFDTITREEIDVIRLQFGDVDFEAITPGTTKFFGVGYKLFSMKLD